MRNEEKMTIKNYMVTDSSRTRKVHELPIGKTNGFGTQDKELHNAKMIMLLWLLIAVVATYVLSHNNHEHFEVSFYIVRRSNS